MKELADTAFAAISFGLLIFLALFFYDPAQLRTFGHEPGLMFNIQMLLAVIIFWLCCFGIYLSTVIYYFKSQAPVMRKAPASESKPEKAAQ